ncbi:deoxyribonuclease II family protein [Algoriphagus pacificus]|uniref:Deoxyribonuclease II family protein n=1 Tax=Algoriphagus pacificus TaxID=2811234 RepID=A0ABS3CK11_9BACT|nr:deoxyribonuclease II family protein [Algoriphagus pacificus]MBN7817444.1 deoxyribonuclease II family protein [Algoriphagus pacificus]
MISPLSNQSGKPVDWWFLYKLPMKIGPENNTTGFEFLYMDSSSTEGLSLSPIHLDHDQSAFGLTLKQVFSDDPDHGYVLWNDEIPPSTTVPNPVNVGTKGHSKGILAFCKKTNSAFYLLHSTPRFPLKGQLDLPEDEKKFGQTFLCVSLKDMDTANKLAESIQMQVEAQVYDSLLPGIESTDAIYKLAKNEGFVAPSSTAKIDFLSAKGEKFTYIAKNKRWSEPPHGVQYGKDFWKDLVAPGLNCKLDVETWRRGLVFGDSTGRVAGETEDIVDLDFGKIGLTGYTWPFSKDHAKWGISIKSDPGYIIIADINRQVSQEKRGGGGIAFQNTSLWKNLDAVEIIEKTIEDDPHHDVS